MKEPKRLLSHGATDFERQLLRAVVSERPSALLRSRMQRGLGLTGPLAWASNVKALFGTASSRFTAGVAAIGVLAAGGFAAYQVLPRADQASETSVTRDLQPARALPTLAAPTLAAPAPPAERAPSAETASPARSPVEAPLATSQPEVRAATTQPVASEDDNQLREEIALLDAARAALQRADRESARVSLSSYRQRFPEGILRREATVLSGRAEAK